MILNPLEGDKCWCSHCTDLRATFFPVCEEHLAATPNGLLADYNSSFYFDNGLRMITDERYWTLFNLIVVYHEYQELWNRKRELP